MIIKVKITIGRGNIRMIERTVYCSPTEKQLTEFMRAILDTFGILGQEFKE